MKDKLKFGTIVIHGEQHEDDWNSSTRSPIYQSTAHVFSKAQDLSDAFAGKTDDHIYMRLTNPTNRVFEDKLSLLEGGIGAIATSSGMSAITIACMAILKGGDEFICGNSLFVSTYSLFTNIFKKYNITPKFVEGVNLDEIKSQITDKTKFIFLETISNPRLMVYDIKKIANLAHDNGIPLIVDNTMATPYLCKPIELGADIVIHSTTKYLNGHGSAVGGVVIDSGNFDWMNGKFPDFKPFVEKKGKNAYIYKTWKENHVCMGTCPAPLHSYLTMIGMDTLVLRMKKHLENTEIIAKYLNDKKEVKWVNYPGLKDNQFYQLSKSQFDNKGFGAMLTFGLKNEKLSRKFIDNLNLINHLANIGDCKTLIIHPKSSQYVSVPDSLCQTLKIHPELLRLSVGIEEPEDIIDDVENALKVCHE